MIFRTLLHDQSHNIEAYIYGPDAIDGYICIL